MPTGPEYVDATLERVHSASAAIAELDGLEPAWSAEAAARLDAIDDLLQGTTDRFFLKTRVCLPFARKCDRAAQALEALLADLKTEPAADAQQQLAAAVDALEKAAKTLDERSMMQGMAIT
jgi:hypothetical protein